MRFVKQLFILFDHLPADTVPVYNLVHSQRLHDLPLPPRHLRHHSSHSPDNRWYFLSQHGTGWPGLHCPAQVHATHSGLACPEN